MAMKRMAIALFTAICICLSPVAAYSFTQDIGSLTLVVAHGDEAINGLRMTVCRVASADDSTGELVYTLTESFENLSVSFGDLSDPDTNKALAELFDNAAGDNAVSRPVYVTDAEGKIALKQLDTGLYLIAQATAEEGGYTIAPFLVPMPLFENDSWQYV
ncbi:MAG: hypothetical protein LBU77_02800, partial [Clostridiales bacterium]|nr:hypothetical protein [Clostridiales bacterium]